MIKLTAIGYLGRDAIVNTVNGKNVINFNVAHTEKYKDAQGTQVDKTIWVDCAYWSDRVAIAPYLKKGTLVYVEGTPDVRTYTTNDGRNGATLSLKISSIQLVGAKNADGTDVSGSQQSYAAAQQQAPVNTQNRANESLQPPTTSAAPTNSSAPVDDDLPF